MRSRIEKVLSDPSLVGMGRFFIQPVLGQNINKFYLRMYNKTKRPEWVKSLYEKIYCQFYEKNTIFIGFYNFNKRIFFG